MKKIESLNKKIKYIFTDIDDTLTTEGILPSYSYSSLWKLYDSGYKIIPVTGRPAGWCEMIARFWPVEAVIGENGGFYFKYDRIEKKMKRYFSQSEEERQQNQKRLEKIKDEVLSKVSGAKIASDQFCRIIDLAIDFCEDVEPLDKSEIKKIVSIFVAHGATAKVSSIHVNGWFGDHDKLSMCKDFCQKEWKKDLSEILSESLFCGDSPNDEPMFVYFENSVGVANINDFAKDIKNLPTYVCQKRGAEGFSEMAEHLLSTFK